MSENILISRVKSVAVGGKLKRKYQLNNLTSFDLFQEIYQDGETSNRISTLKIFARIFAIIVFTIIQLLVGITIIHTGVRFIREVVRNETGCDSIKEEEIINSRKYFINLSLCLERNNE